MSEDIDRIQNNVHCYESTSLANDDVCTALGIIKQQAEQIERLVNLIKDVHKSKILLMALDGNTGEEHEGEMEAITNLWNRIKQVYRDYPAAPLKKEGVG